VKRCLVDYLKTGWTGSLPASCAGQRLTLPDWTSMYLLWGWPGTFNRARARERRQRAHLHNDPARLPALRTLGVDGILTDRIELMGPEVGQGGHEGTRARGHAEAEPGFESAPACPRALVPSCPPLRRRLARQLRLAALTGVALLLALALIRTLPHPPLSSHAPQSVAVQDRHGKLLRLTLASDDRYRLWLPLAEISPRLVEAVLLPRGRLVPLASGGESAEPGARRVEHLCQRRGAHRRLHPDHAAGAPARAAGHTLARGKLRQIGQALWLEARYSKDEILEAYSISRPTAAISRAWAPPA
jgi:hypothetical protein